jgi:hypothetical protein
MHCGSNRAFNLISLTKEAESTLNEDLDIIKSIVALLRVKF